MTNSPENLRKILVTGSDGLIGWHLRAWLYTLAERFEVNSCNRQQFNDADYLKTAVSSADVIVHLAGMNRGDEEEIYNTNRDLAQRIVSFCEQTESKPHVIYSSSTHIDGPSRYGASKKIAGEILEQWAQRAGAKFCNMVLPHVFGEHGKPFYNSAVSTFCHQLANGESLQVNGDGQVNLFHTHDVALLVTEIIDGGITGEQRPDGSPMSVQELATRLETMTGRYLGGVIPQFNEKIDWQLFNTWRSYLPHEKRAIDLTLHEDNRGDLFEAARADGKGQVFLSTSHPGITRGEHFHFRKVERFLVVQGTAEIKLRRIFTDDVFTCKVDGSRPQAFDIPTLHTHNITNVGDGPLLALFWTGEHFDPDDADTWRLLVEQSEPQTAKA